MLIKDQNIDIKEEGTQSFYEEGVLRVYNFGCLIADADALKLFYQLKDIIKEPTIVVLCCNATKSYETNDILNIMKLKDKYPDHKMLITGCINEIVESKFKRLGKVIYKKDMWDLKNYE